MSAMSMCRPSHFQIYGGCHPEIGVVGVNRGPRRLHLGSDSINGLFRCDWGDPCSTKAPRYQRLIIKG